MANNKLTDSLRNSIVAENKSLNERVTPASKSVGASQKQPIATKPTVTPTKVQAKTAAPIPAKKTAATKKTATSVKKATTAATRKKLIKKPKAQTKATTQAHKATSKSKADTYNPNDSLNFAANLAHTKLHSIVETHHHLCETCLDNLQRINNSLHDYLNQLVEINNLGALIKLNLNYLSSTPTRIQEMIAQNKSIFSDFFKFAKLEDK